MADPIRELKGITPEVLAKLKGMGISDTDEFLAAAKTPKARQALAEGTGADVKMIGELANRADLCRVKGVAGVYADLLENAGVDTSKELARRTPENLHAKLLEVNAAKKLTQRPPTLDAVNSWVAEAKKLPAALEY